MEEEMTAMAIGRDKLGTAILAALGIEATQARRIIVDCEAGRIGKVYIEMIASEKMLSLDWDYALEGVKVMITEK